MAALWSAWGSDRFAELVEKATSELLPAGQEDIALNLEVCDQVRAKQVPPRQAMQTIKKRLGHKNPNVVLLALGVSCGPSSALRTWAGDRPTLILVFMRKYRVAG